VKRKLVRSRAFVRAAKRLLKKRPDVAEDLKAALELISEDEAASSLKKVAKRLIKEGVVRSFHPQVQLFVLEQRAGRDCLFLDEKTRLCSVYEKRPEVCRAFPKIGPRPGHCPSVPAQPPGRH